jgi:glycosyltransferase involved in cell wall biosynthesis
MKSPHAVMLLSNPFRPDPRVLKEAESLQSAGYNVTILCWDRQAAYPSEESLPSGVHVIRIQDVPSDYGIGSRQLFRLSKFWSATYPLLKSLKPALLHCHDFDTLPAGLFWGRLHRLPVIYDAHEYYAELVKPRLRGVPGIILYQIIRTAEHIAARQASAVITVDDKLGAIYRKLNKNVLVVGHYPALKSYNDAAPVFTRNELSLIYVGRISTDRGLMIYLETLRLLRKAGVPARLLLVGDFTPSREEDAFRQSTQDIERYVDWVGWVDYDQVPGLLKTVDIGLVILKPEPRYVAALPVKLFEYMAAGLPVIASDFPEIAKIVQGAKCGALVDPDKSPDLIAEIIKDWWSNPAIPRLLGNNGFQAARQKFHWENISGQIAGLYRALLR